MLRLRLACVIVPLGGLLALTSAPLSAKAQQPATSVKGKLSAHALSQRIDKHISERWNKEGVKPALLSDDATFFRRVHLDITGRIPSVLDIGDFLDDDRPDKRRIWIDKLLDGPEFADHMATFYRTLIIPQVENQEAQFLLGGFDNWLRKKFKDNVPYNQLVRELLTSSPGQGFNGNDINAPSAAAFFAANEYKPENLAGTTARAFLGVKIECAQCHKHPFADWTREQFWEFAAFFANVSRNNGIPVPSDIDDAKPDIPKAPPKVEPKPQDGPTIPIPKTDQVARAKFLDGNSPDWKKGGDPRKLLSEWIVSDSNPYFARIAVNQLWFFFLGTGLVDPFDDFGEHNPASHQELLDELADQFVKNNYDLKFLARAIINSRVYQLSSEPQAGKKKADEPESLRLFTRMPLRALTGEQIYDSLSEVMDAKVDKSRPGLALGLTPREEFIAKFANPEAKRVDTHSSILQALHLMNGKFMANVTSPERNKNLQTIISSDSSIPDKIRTLYYLALARQPRPDELDRMTRFVQAGMARNEGGQALSDVLWVLLNSAEFSTNR